MVYAVAPNFDSIPSTSLVAKTPNFAVFLASPFCGVASWRQYEKVENGAQLQAFQWYHNRV